MLKTMCYTRSVILGTVIPFVNILFHDLIVLLKRCSSELHKHRLFPFNLVYVVIGPRLYLFMDC